MRDISFMIWGILILNIKIKCKNQVFSNFFEKAAQNLSPQNQKENGEKKSDFFAFFCFVIIIGVEYVYFTSRKFALWKLKNLEHNSNNPF
jgi:hypothetical protein